MSILTKVLKLFCYDPETDGANTFNIPKALNENWEKIDQLVLLAVAAAAAYDPEGSYAVGDYCTHGGKLHKCSTPIESGAAWNAEHWTETTVAAELAAVRTELSKKIPLSYPPVSGAAIATQILASFFGFDATCTDIPVKSAGCGLTLSPWGDGIWGTQIISIVGSLYYRTYSNYGNSVTDWLRLVTAKPPYVRNLTLKSGFTANGDCTFFVTQEGVVFLAGGVSGTLPTNQDTQIGTLPADAGPSSLRRRAAVTNAGAAYIDIHTDGTVWAHPFAAASQCWFVAPFAAGGGS